MTPYESDMQDLRQLMSEYRAAHVEITRLEGEKESLKTVISEICTDWGIDLFTVDGLSVEKINRTSSRLDKSKLLLKGLTAEDIADCTTKSTTTYYTVREAKEGDVTE